jgi:uncharacterized protein YeaO (DUF488 family)
MRKIKIKRIYDEPSSDDGYRILVDRLWPRGISKKDANLREWNKEIAPSSELRKWFDHKEFAHRYREELKGKEDVLNELRKIAKNEPVCLLFAAKDPDLNQAVVLRDVLLNTN